MTYEGQLVLFHGNGQCQHCRHKVIRVLVQSPGGSRIWFPADLGIGPNTFDPHICMTPSAPTPNNVRTAA